MRALNNNPKNGFSKWNEFENKVSLNLRELQEEHMDLGFKANGVGIVNGNTGGFSPFGKPPKELVEKRHNERC